MVLLPPGPAAVPHHGSWSHYLAVGITTRVPQGRPLGGSASLPCRSSSFARRRSRAALRGEGTRHLSQVLGSPRRVILHVSRCAGKKKPGRCSWNWRPGTHQTFVAPMVARDCIVHHMMGLRTWSWNLYVPSSAALAVLGCPITHPSALPSVPEKNPYSRVR
jgi:hypothetical protein